MQKFVFITLTAVLAFLLFTCIPLGPPDYDGYEFEYTNVEYSPDGGSITIYLDGSMPVRNNRAINLKWAQIGHDFFEVAFMSGSTVARAVWETGHAAGVNGVVRGVDYDSAVTTGLASGHGAAILFVGKKSDKTLLGLGRLTGVDGVNETLITADSKKVTFSVAAIDVGVRYKRTEPYPVGSIQSSFLTAALGNSYQTVNEGYTDTPRIRVGMHHFPVFRFRAGDRDVYAEYRFKLDPNSGFLIGDFNDGILQADDAAFVERPGGEMHLVPRYPKGDGTWDSNLVLPLTTESNTVVAFRYNTPPDGSSPFENPVKFTFTTKADNTGKIFAFSFQVPVYPLTNADSRGTKGNMWYLRTGYDSYKYDLDDGEGGTGGAILIGTGPFPDSDPYLWVNPPNKAMYTGNNVPADYIFDLKGIRVELRIGSDDNEYQILKPILTISDTDVPPANIPAGLSFYLNRADGTDRVGPLVKTTNLAQYLFSPANTPPDPNTVYVTNGMFNIIVEYNDDGVIYTGSFTLYLFTGGEPPGADNIPEGNRFIIATQNEFNDFINRLATNTGVDANRNYLLVFFDNFNITSTVTLQGGRFYFIIIAAKPGVTVGGNPGFIISNANANNSTFYLGKWPFNDTLSVMGLAINSEPLTIDAGGSNFITRGSNTIEIVEGPGFTINGNVTN